jgi:hypothetical protein
MLSKQVDLNSLIQIKESVCGGDHNLVETIGLTVSESEIEETAVVQD